MTTPNDNNSDNLLEEVESTSAASIAGGVGDSEKLTPENSGSTINNIHTQREATVYAIFDTEIDTLGLMGFISNAAFSFAAGCASFSFALFMEKQVSPEATPAGEVLMTAGPWASGVLGVLSLAIGIWAWQNRGSTIQKIKDKSNKR